MIRSWALTILTLPEADSKDDIEKAYQRLVRRYPPEFGREKFRRIDDL